ncbi:MAG: thiamine phosphate synthase [Kiloniellales bacterium]
MRLPRPPLLLITDRHQARLPLEQVAEAAFEAGCRWLLLRDKDLPGPERLVLARQLVALARPHGALVQVSGDPGIVEAAGAGGVHLPRDGDCAAARARLGPEALIGLSAHDLGEARSAERRGADYVTLSPVFESTSKPGYGPALGPDGFGRIAAAISIPVLALGGVGVARISACLAAGATGVAVMGEIMRAADIHAKTKSLIRACGGKDQPSLETCS